MNRLACLALASLFLIAPHQKAEAQINPVFLGLALKCIATGVIGTTAVILYRCEPDYFLCCHQVEGEDPNWFVSQATARTLLKTSDHRCEGPWKHREEPDFRAWANNHDLAHPMFPCGPLGVIPGPTHTNWTLVSISQSFNGGRASSKWRIAGSVLIEPGESDWSICLLGPDGTNGMNSAQLRQISECDAVIEHALPALGEIKEYAVRGTEVEVPERLIHSAPTKPTTQSQ